MNFKNPFIYVLPFWLIACGQPAEQREKQPIRVKTEQVTCNAQTGEGRLYVGIVEENVATAVSFTSMGAIRRVLVSEGQAVSRGQLIAELDDTQARNMLLAAEAQNKQAEDALGRYSQLHEQGSMTDAQWVEIQSKVEQARSQLAIAKKNLADCQLLAPVGGVIGRKNVNSGETAMPSQAVVTIMDISQVKVKVSVPETEMGSISASTPSHIHVDAIGRDYEGGSIEKGIQADALTHTYDIRIRVNNSDWELLPGMVAKVQLGKGTPSTSRALTLPLTAVQRKADGTLFVWTVDDTHAAHRTPITIGKTIGNLIEIQKGLTEGQHVIIEGWQKVSEGTKVSEK